MVSFVFYACTLYHGLPEHPSGSTLVDSVVMREGSVRECMGRQAGRIFMRKVENILNHTLFWKQEFMCVCVPPYHESAF